MIYFIILKFEVILRANEALDRKTRLSDHNPTIHLSYIFKKSQIFKKAFVIVQIKPSNILK